MNSPRVRRLQNDYERISSRFAEWPLVQVELARGVPPDTYRIRYNIRGLRLAPDGRIFEQNEHLLEISLGLEYPRRQPRLRILTPLFHPNFDNREVCAQDIYAASEGLDDLIIRIGRMIAYQEFNTKSPLNGIAAKWAAENCRKLPVDPREIAPPAKRAPTAKPQTLISSQQQVSKTTSSPSKVIITSSDLSRDTTIKACVVKAGDALKPPAPATTKKAKSSHEGNAAAGTRIDENIVGNFPYPAELERKVYSFLVQQKIDEVTMMQAKVRAEGDKDKAEAIYYKIKYKEIIESGAIERFKDELLFERSKVTPTPSSPVFRSKEIACPDQGVRDAIETTDLIHEGVVQKAPTESSDQRELRVQKEAKAITQNALKVLAEEKRRQQDKQGENARAKNSER